MLIIKKQIIKCFTWSKALNKFFTKKGVQTASKYMKRYSTSLVFAAAAAAAKLLQSCPTLCDPIDGSPPGSSVPGILQARTLEWTAISFSKACMSLGKCKSKPRTPVHTY